MAWDARNLVSTRGERVVPEVSRKVVILDDVGVRLALSRLNLPEHIIVGSLPRNVEAVRMQVSRVRLVERVRATVSLRRLGRANRVVVLAEAIHERQLDAVADLDLPARAAELDHAVDLVDARLELRLARLHEGHVDD